MKQPQKKGKNKSSVDAVIPFKELVIVEFGGSTYFRRKWKHITQDKINETNPKK